MPDPKYLEPYLTAAGRFGGGFGSLLWASPKTQAVRFAALARNCSMAHATVLDAGCGRADFLDFLIRANMPPRRYLGLEAVEALAAAAEKKKRPMATIVRGDFISHPSLLAADADVIVFSGSLNTLSVDQFYQTLTAAWEQTRRELVFNFLCSPKLAAGKHLNWYDTGDVILFASRFTDEVTMDAAYLDGDCTITMRRL